MQLTVVPHEETIFTIQKSCLSQWTVFGDKHPENSVTDGRCALIQVSDFVFCVCKLFYQREVHPSYVYLDSSVVHFKCKEAGMPRVPLIICDGYVHDNKIEILPHVKPIKKVILTVIVENISDVREWKEQVEKLKVVVLEILKMYVLTKDCVVFLRNLKRGLRHGIHGLVIHSCFSSCEEIVPGQVNSKSEVSISGVTSKLRFDQFLEQSTVPKMGGLEEPASLLRDIIQTNIDLKSRLKSLSLKPQRQVCIVYDVFLAKLLIDSITVSPCFCVF